MSSSGSTFRNTVLQHFTEDIIERLDLQPVELELRKDLTRPGESIKQIYFVEAGIGSMTTSFQNGDQVEVSMFGYESVIGVSALMGAKKSLNNVFMQLGGHGYASSLAAATREFERGELFHDLALRYVQAQLTLAMQSAACNATHNQEQRLARWLLICADRAQTDLLALSQEFLAQMLGSTRTSVTIAAKGLKDAGLIDYKRGSLHILDAKGLEERACECYQVVKDHLANFAEFDTGFTV